MNDRTATRWRRCATLLPFSCLVLCSLVLTAATNYLVGTTLNVNAPDMSWIASAAIPSALLITILYAVFGSRDAIRWPRLDSAVWRRVFGISAIWLSVWMAGSVVAAVLAGHWIHYATGFPLVAAFILFGPAGEELLFRGLIFEKARVIWPTKAAPAMCISTAAFSLHHLALGAAPHGLAIAQILFTIPMGLVLALLRERTRSILPGWLLHVATNCPAVL
jgi:membrane protease YdiL (CAAX protease family)